MNYYNGAYTVEELAHRPVAMTYWGLTAKTAEASGRQREDGG